eukprot:TRINITY_DN31671_c0_g1_i1.p1 TRINITY_DN31671_c0_g1~~TRINITY_DN31671_c0_g1_i1.p1  ORF type:complete len:694 (-),score=165.57 TRINITY_DN31671_c0_g1_i1:28-2109(-)
MNIPGTPPLSSEEVYQLRADIASTKSALGALAAVNGRSPGLPPSPKLGGLRTSRQSAADAGMFGIESFIPRSSRQSQTSGRFSPRQRSMSPRQQAREPLTAPGEKMKEQFDAVLKASVSRLETRVKALEGQGVRSDRRSAELAGLAQALTEEQRALLTRLDRIEEYVRVGQHRESPVSVEDLARRLGRIEREQRAAALNLRLVVSVSEEAQQRQLQRTRNFEDLVEARFRPLEERLSMSVPPFAECRTPRKSPRPGSLGKFLDAESTPDSEAQDTGSFTGGGSGSSKAGRAAHTAAASTRLTETGNTEVGSVLSQLQAQAEVPSPERTNALELIELRARLDELAKNFSRPDSSEALEARVRGLADSLEELRSRLGDGASPARGNRAELGLLNNEVSSLSRRLEQQASSIEGLASKFASAGDSLAQPSKSEGLVALQASHDDQMQRLRDHIQDEMVQLRVELAQELQRSAKPSEDELQSLHLFGCSGEAPLPKEVLELRRGHEKLQEMVESTLISRMLSLEQRVPEALTRVEQLRQQQIDRIGKDEEHDVRLAMALSRLGTQEEKLQSVVDRVERLPCLNQVRSMWREELQRRLDEEDLKSLVRNVNSQGKVLDEVQARVQDVWDHLAYTGLAGSFFAPEPPDPSEKAEESCPHCSFTYLPDSAFCRNCGKKRAEAEVTVHLTSCEGQLSMGRT